MSSRDRGRAGEDIAISHIRELGFKIVERNFYAKKFGEIDIIATKGEVWHFIEVKSAVREFEAIYNLSPRKLRRVINSTNYYLKYRNLDVLFSIDVIVVSSGGVEFIENITI
ncbi:MAG: YraN family protein [Epsilonproteobacteria bacterium]|nr:YraN family protein [Campylobacterota bacterium]